MEAGEVSCPKDSFLKQVCLHESQTSAISPKDASSQQVNNKLRGSITVRLTSCLFRLDSAALLMLNKQQFYLFGQTQTSQTGGQLYSHSSSYGVSKSCCKKNVGYLLLEVAKQVGEVIRIFE